MSGARVLGWILTGSASLAVDQEAELPRLQAGAELRLRLPPGPPDSARRKFVVQTPSSGRFAIVAHAQDCDVALGPEGALLDRDRGGGLDERLELADAPAISSTLVVGATVPLVSAVEIVLTLVSAVPATNSGGIATEVAWFEQFLGRSGAVAELKIRRTLVELSVDCAVAHEPAALERVVHLLELRCVKAGASGCQVLRALVHEPRTDPSVWNVLLPRLEDLIAGTDVVCLLALADHCLTASDAQGAVALLTRAKERANCGESRLLEAVVQAHLGEALQQAKNHDRALDAFSAACLLAHGLDGPAVADVLLRAGRFLLESGDTRAARKPYELAETLRRLTDDQRLDLCARICEIDLREGRHEEAAVRLRTLQSQVDARGPKSVPIEIIEAVAKFLYRMGKYSDSQAYFKIVLDAIPPGNVPVRGKMFLDQSLLCEDNGDLDGAVTCLNRALQEFGDAVGYDADRASCLLNRARLHRLLGDLDLAQQDLESGLQLAIDKHLEQHRYGACDGLAALALARGDLSTAREQIAVAVNGYRELGQWDYLLDTLLTQAEVELESQERDGARAVLDQAEQLLGQPDILGPHPSAEVRSRYVKWGWFAQDLAMARITAANPSTRPREVAWGLEQADRWRARALLAGIAERSPPAEKRTEGLLTDLQELLGPARLLVEYATGSTHLFAYVVGHDVLEVVDLGKSGDLRASVEAFREQVLLYPRLDDAGAVAAAGHALYQSLLAAVLKVASKLPQTLVFVPNEFLETLPFEALVVEPAETFRELRFVLDKYPVSYAPSSAVLVALSRKPSAHGHEIHRALFAADPDFETSPVGSPREGLPDAGLRRLPQSRNEVIAIANLLIPPDEGGGADLRNRLYAWAPEERRHGRLDEGPIELLLGAEANVDFFLDQNNLRQFNLIHFATHTDNDPEDPSQFGLVLSTGRRGTRVLDLAAIHRLELDAELVVLSACTSAGGRMVKGEGVQSLARAFLERGARGVVATLSRVDDKVANELMQKFYGHLLRPPGPSAPVACPLVAALIARFLKPRRMLWPVAILLLLALTLSGGLDVWRGLSPIEKIRLFDAEQLRVAELIKQRVPPHVLMLSAPIHNSALALSGRQMLMGYPGHLWSHGIPFETRARDVKIMYRGGAEAERLFQQYGIDYVIVGPVEYSEFNADDGYFAEKYQAVIDEAGYRVYQINPSAKN